MAYSALLDASVLHPMALCDLLIRIALRDLYLPLWSADILDETARSVIRRFPHHEDRIRRRIDRMAAVLPTAAVEGYQPLIARFVDFGTDAHVVAAAVAGRADVIVTSNLRDFPQHLLDPLKLHAETPDDFLVNQWWLNPAAVQAALEEQSAGTKNPHLTVTQLLAETLPRLVPKFCEIVLKARRS